MKPNHSAPSGQAPTLGGLIGSYALSSYRESLLEQVFTAEVIQACWLSLPPLEIAHAMVDSAGYDLVVSCGRVTRHIQLKAVRRARVSAHRDLANKPAGCCVLLLRSSTDAGTAGEPRVTLRYRYVGGKTPLEPFTLDPEWPPAKKTMHSKTEDGQWVKKEKEHHVLVPRSAFSAETGIAELVTALFGDVAA